MQIYLYLLSLYCETETASSCLNTSRKCRMRALMMELMFKFQTNFLYNNLLVSQCRLLFFFELLLFIERNKIKRDVVFALINHFDFVNSRFRCHR